MSISILAAAGLMVTSVQGADPAASYDIRVAVDSDEASQTRVDIVVSFIGDDDGETTVTLPSSWGGAEELWNVIHDLRVTQGSAQFLAGENAAHRILTHAPGARIELSYQVIQDWAGVPMATQGNNYRPTIQPEYVHLIGNTYFLTAGDVDGEQPVSVTISTPEGWTLASDLEHGAINFNTLLHSVFVAGDFRVEERTIDDATIRVALRGDWEFEDSAFADQTQDVLRATHSYWQSPGEEYLVTVIPLQADAGWSSLGGTNLGDAFAFFSDPLMDPDRALRTLTHEHAHTWNPGRLGGLDEGPNEPAGYWFSEGFTDYITQRVGVSTGLWSVESSVQQWNELFSIYASSPVVSAPNSAILNGFWTDGNLQRLPYQRGMMFAALIEHQIRRSGDGSIDMDDILHAMLEIGVAEGTPNAPERFQSEVLRQTGLDLSNDIQRYIMDGEAIYLEADTFSSCGPLETFDSPVFDYGMTGHRDEDGVFVLGTVDPNGPAAAAGFEPGMRLLDRIGGRYGDASVDSTFRLEHNGQIRELSYRPTNGHFVRMQRIAFDLDTVDLEACGDQLSGR